MIITSHRINTIRELKATPVEYGVEIDIRADNNDLILAHDPLVSGESLYEFLKEYKHKFIILNIKCDGIEGMVRHYLNLFKIKDYFFLDSSFPTINSLANSGEKNVALRYSEYEPMKTLINMSGRINWVWVDCFTKSPLTCRSFQQLKSLGYNICIVSPELQGHFERTRVMVDFLKFNNIIPDMVCTKTKNIEIWEEISKL